MIDPITELLLQEELPSDSAIQSQFTAMIDDESKKCKSVMGSPNYDKCKAFATVYAIKKFLYKYNDVPDEVVEMAQRKIRETKNFLEKKDS
jgi:hypothetical protein